jgi:hypothetical protein
MMRIATCKQCTYHLENMADCALCRFNHETEYKVVYKGDVLSCPLEAAMK